MAGERCYVRKPPVDRRPNFGLLLTLYKALVQTTESLELLLESFRGRVRRRRFIIAGLERDCETVKLEVVVRREAGQKNDND